MCVCVHEYIVYIHTSYMHAYIHTYMCVSMYIYIYIYVDPHTHTHTHTHTHSNQPTHAFIFSGFGGREALLWPTSDAGRAGGRCRYRLCHCHIPQQIRGIYLVYFYLLSHVSTHPECLSCVCLSPVTYLNKSGESILFWGRPHVPAAYLDESSIYL